MASLRHLVETFWRRVIASAGTVPPHSLGLFRWIYGLFLLAFDTPYCAWVDGVPRAFFDPPPISLAYCFSRFPPPPFFAALDCLCLASLCCVTVGYRTRVATAVLLGTDLLSGTFRYSLGKIDHDILVVAVLGCMIVADWGRYYSLDSVLHRDRVAKDDDAGARRGLAVFAVLLAFGMVTAGFQKAKNWIDFDLATSGTLAWFLPNFFSLRRSLLLAPFAHRAPTIVFELADYAAPVFELSGLAALLWSRRAWLVWLLVACGFHVMNALVLNISFADYMILYAAFVNLRPVRGAVGSVSREGPFWVGVASVFVLGGWHLATRLRGEGSTVAFVVDPIAIEEVRLLAALPIGVVAMALILREMRPRPARSRARAASPA